MRFTSLSLDYLESWARLNNVELHGVQVKSHIIAEDGSDRGGGLIATTDHTPSEVLLTVPRDLVLNKELIEQAAKTDKNLRQVLEAVGTTFSQTPRTMVMVFLLLQLTYASPDQENNVVVTTPMNDYAKFLPKNVPLPTLYTADVQELLSGTSLEAALNQKLKRLDSEFAHLESSTQDLDWCQQVWWNSPQSPLTLDDWKAIDAIYRSRALELPNGSGDSMVPVLDMANHASDGKYTARFQPDASGNVQLVARDNVSIKAGDEITIMYGCGGACEMIFSYGFLERDAQSAREIFLDLTIPDDDPLKRAKFEFAKESPGVRIFTNSEGAVQWESSFVWWACINEEDGLDFRVLQENDGAMDLRATWKGAEFEAEDLKKMLLKDALWDVFLLRAVVQLQTRVEAQGAELSLVEDTFDESKRRGDGGPIVDTIYHLRDLEMELLMAAYQMLEIEKARLLDSDTVRMYLNQENPDRTDGISEEDFS